MAAAEHTNLVCTLLSILFISRGGHVYSSHSVVVSTPDFESGVVGSNPSGSTFFRSLFFYLGATNFSTDIIPARDPLA